MLCCQSTVVLAAAAATGVISSFSIMTGDTNVGGSFYFFTSSGLLGKGGQG
jgi:hypothetical protein